MRKESSVGEILQCPVQLSPGKKGLNKLAE
jgi:hypothetical protein